MSQEEAMRRWHQLTASRPQPVAMSATPITDNLERLQRAMTEVQGILCDLGVKDRMSLTLGDVTELLRSVR